MSDKENSYKDTANYYQERYYKAERLIADYERVLKAVAHAVSLLPKHLLYDAKGNRSSTNQVVEMIQDVLGKHNESI